MHITLEVWHVPLGIKVNRPLAKLMVIVGEVMKMEQTLHVGLFHVWAPVWCGGKEGFVRTKMFLRLGGCFKTNPGLVENIDLVSVSDWGMWKLSVGFVLRYFRIRGGVEDDMCNR